MFKVTARDQGHYKGTSGAFVTYCNISFEKRKKDHLPQPHPHPHPLPSQPSEFFFRPPTSKKLRGHICLGLSVRLSVRPSRTSVSPSPLIGTYCVGYLLSTCSLFCIGVHRTTQLILIYYWVFCLLLGGNFVWEKPNKNITLQMSVHLSVRNTCWQLRNSRTPYARILKFYMWHVHEK